MMPRPKLVEGWTAPAAPFSWLCHDTCALASFTLGANLCAPHA